MKNISVAACRKLALTMRTTDSKPKMEKPIPHILTKSKPCSNQTEQTQIIKNQQYFMLINWLAPQEAVTISTHVAKNVYSKYIKQKLIEHRK